jgi:hypothetical protein
MPICARHLAELAAYLPGVEARPVLTMDQVDSLVMEFRLRRDDILALYGPRDPMFGVEACRMCETLPVDGNVCHADDCARPLHPQWPVVYCTDACAVDDC